MRDAGCGMRDAGCGMWDAGCWLAFLSMETDSPDTVLEGSTVIWAIMAVTALWLLGLFVMAIGYTLFECLGPCTTPAQPWVWWTSLAIALMCFVWSGQVAVRMTRLNWAWLSVVPGILFLLIVVF